MVMNEHFSLQPYEHLINEVASKIGKIEEDLKHLGNDNDYLRSKEDELRNLKREHEDLVRLIKHKSVSQISLL